MTSPELSRKPPARSPAGELSPLQLLTSDQVQRIDELLVSVGEYGEVHLIVQHGELRYINRVESHKAWNDNRKK